MEPLNEEEQALVLALRDPETGKKLREIKEKAKPAL